MAGLRPDGNILDMRPCSTRSSSWLSQVKACSCPLRHTSTDKANSGSFRLIRYPVKKDRVREKEHFAVIHIYFTLQCHNRGLIVFITHERSQAMNIHTFSPKNRWGPSLTQRSPRLVLKLALPVSFLDGVEEPRHVLSKTPQPVGPTALHSLQVPSVGLYRPLKHFLLSPEDRRGWMLLFPLFHCRIYSADQ